MATVARIVLAATLLAGAFGNAAVAQAPAVKRLATIEVPGEPLAAFDISFVDPTTEIYYLADRSNKGVDMIDARTNKFVGRIGGFVGPSTKNDTAGPNGVIVIPKLHQLWAGDGDSTVKVIDLKAKPPKIVATITTGGKARVDEVAYDERDGIVLFVNDADDPPFVTLISSKPDHAILAQIKMAEATDGLEQPVWDAAAGRFYLSVPQLNKKKEDGGIAVIDPKSKKVAGLYKLSKCVPAGLALGPKDQLVAGCSEDAIEDGFPPQTIVLSAKTGSIVKTLTEIGGSDQVWYNPHDGRYYLAARGMPGGPVLGIVDAKANKWLVNLPTAKNAHSVAADPHNDHVFVPLTPNPDCPKGCIAVYGVAKG